MISAGPPRPHLALDCARLEGGPTVLARRYYRYPIALTGTFHDDPSHPGCLRIVPQSMSGGLYAGEHIVEHHRVRAAAAVRVHDQGAIVVHAAKHGTQSHWERCLRVEALARAEFVNHPLVLLPHAAVSLSTDLTVDHSAAVMIAEGFGVHRLAAPGPGQRCPANEAPRFCVAQCVTVKRPGAPAPIVLERFHVALAEHEARWYGKWLMITPVGATHTLEPLVDRLWAVLDRHPGIYAGVSTLPNAAGIAAQIIAGSAGNLKTVLDDLCEGARNAAWW